jgi:hypothetical protein
MFQDQHLNPAINVGGSAVRKWGKGVRGEKGKREKGEREEV